MAFDDIIRAMGGFGRYQRRIYLLLCLPLISCGFHTMAGVFLAAQADFRCLLPHENPENVTYRLSPNLPNISYPWHYTSEDWSQCERYDGGLADQFYYSDGNFTSTTPNRKCDAFVYDKTTYELTTTTDFNLVCDNAWLRATSDSSFMIGSMLGATIFGGLSDRYGRKPIYCAVLFLQAISGLLVAASPNIISYIILRLILGAAVSGVYLISYVSAVEMVVPKKRLMVGMGIQVFFTSGYILTTGFAYFIRNWRMLQIALSVPNLVFIFYWWFIPESARWLVNTGRFEKAKDFLQKGALLENRVKISRDTLDSMLSNCSVSKSDLKRHSALDLLRYPNLKRKSLILFFVWFVNNFTYYGLSWNTSSLVGNDYINFAIAGLVEIPAQIFLLSTLNRWGRKKILCPSMMLAGTSLLLRIFVPDDMPWLEVALTMTGKFAITASYMTVYIFTTEQYPTVIRNAGIGACSTCARIGGILTSYINYSSVIWKPLPVVIFGCGSVIAGLLTLLLPETLNEKLPETIQDGEQFGKKNIKLDKTLSNCTVLISKLSKTEHRVSENEM